MGVAVSELYEARKCVKNVTLFISDNFIIIYIFLLNDKHMIWRPPGLSELTQ